MSQVRTVLKRNEDGVIFPYTEALYATGAFTPVDFNADAIDVKAESTPVEGVVSQASPDEIDAASTEEEDSSPAKDLPIFAEIDALRTKDAAKDFGNDRFGYELDPTSMKLSEMKEALKELIA